MSRVLNAGLRIIGLFFVAGFVVPATSSWAASLLKTVPVGHDPGQLVADPAAHNIYVVNRASNSVSVLDSEQLTVRKVISVGSMPAAIAANPPASMVYVANSGSGTISAIKAIAAAKTWTVGGTLTSMAVDSSMTAAAVR